MDDIRPTYPNTSVFCLSSSNVNLIHACYDCYEALKSFVLKFLLISSHTSETSTFLLYYNNIKVQEQLKLYLPVGVIYHTYLFAKAYQHLAAENTQVIFQSFTHTHFDKLSGVRYRDLPARVCEHETRNFTLQKMPFLNCVTVTQNMCIDGFLHPILCQNILARDDV